MYAVSKGAAAKLSRPVIHKLSRVKSGQYFDEKPPSPERKPKVLQEVV